MIAISSVIFVPHYRQTWFSFTDISYKNIYQASTFALQYQAGVGSGALQMQNFSFSNCSNTLHLLQISSLESSTLSNFTFSDMTDLYTETMQIFSISHVKLYNFTFTNFQNNGPFQNPIISITGSDLAAELEVSGIFADNSIFLNTPVLSVQDTFNNVIVNNFIFKDVQLSSAQTISKFDKISTFSIS